MDQSDKLNNCKKEIRSLLLPYQKGCYLAEFNHAYRELLGRKLPFKDFGYFSDIEFLYSMPDVVKITPNRTGEYHLFGVADENTIHIQKMVVRQKPAKGKALPRSFRFPRTHIIPPRFAENIARHIDQTPKGLKRFQNQTSFQRKEELKPPTEPVVKEPSLSDKTYQKQVPKLPPKASPKDEVIALLQHFGNRLPIKDVLFEYSRMYNKDLSLSKYGYSSVEECLEDIPELYMENIDRCSYVVYDAFAESHDSQPTSQQGNSSRIAHENNEEPMSTYAEHRSQNDGGSFIPSLFKNKLKMVAQRYKEIRSSEFSSCFEKVTGTALDIHSLGYRCLTDLIDAVPDIFTRSYSAGSRSDFIISAASESSNSSHYSSSLLGAPLVHKVVLNIRNILEAYSEGIEIQEFPSIYSINCADVLQVQDFGFEDLETFLKSIKNQVPLTIDSSEGVKVIHLVNTNISSNENIPFDAALPNFKFLTQSLPSDLDLSMYVPVYTSSITDPDELYIQLQGSDTADEMFRISDIIETFYNGSKSDLYKMKKTHIKVGASCIAKWPTDNHWYRAEITSIPSLDTVSVFYVDYGTKDTISINLLRYIRKEFVDLPAQAIKCRISLIEPANNAKTWSAESRARLLNLCIDKSLMAKIEGVGAEDGVYSIVLCDTNGKEDVYITDVLIKEGLAAFNTEVIDAAAVINPTYNNQFIPYGCHGLNALQILQAKYHLQALLTIVPAFARNKNFVNVVNEVNRYIPNSDTENQTAYSVPHSTTSGPPGFHNLQPSPYAYSTTNGLHTQSLYSPATFADPIIPAPKDSNLTTTPKILAPSPDDNYADESDIFYDDDDETFLQFCEETLRSIKLTRVRRVQLSDGYKFHVIVYENKPFVSSGDISHLIWNNKDADYLLRRLRAMDVDMVPLKLYEVDHEDLFQQLERYSVKGVTRTSCGESFVSLFSLNIINKILNMFGHPSLILRTRIVEEISNFDPEDPIWMASRLTEPLESDEEHYSGATDDDKIDKLCLSDLYTMKESIKQRRNKIQIYASVDEKRPNRDEMQKLDQLMEKVLQRIQEIKEICNMFS